VVVLFFFGPPQPNLEQGVGMGLEDSTPLADGRTVAEHNRETEKRRQLHTSMSKVGLGLVFLGFAFQLWATYVSA
jgi:hypothetical protein